MKRIFLISALFLMLTLTSCRTKPRTPSETYSEAKTIFKAANVALADMKENDMKMDGFQVLSSEMDMCIVTRDFNAEKFFQYFGAYVNIEVCSRCFFVLNGNYECIYAAAYDGKYIESYPSGIVTGIKDGEIETQYMYADEQHKKCNYTFDEIYNSCVKSIKDYEKGE